MLEYPEITPNYLLNVVETGRSCQATKMGKYYSKVVGGVISSNIEQLKIALLVYILEQTHKLDLTCFDYIPEGSDISYLRNFINYLNVECADCGFTFTGYNSSASSTTIGLPLTDTAEEATPVNDVEGDGINDALNYILLEDATYITLEDSSGSHLMENN